MSDYYTKRKDAIQEIEALYAKNQKISKISLKIAKKFGFSKKFVKNTIDLLEEVIDEQESEDSQSSQKKLDFSKENPKNQQEEPKSDTNEP